MVGRLYVISGPKDAEKLYVLDRLSVYEVGKASGSHVKLHDEGAAMNHCRLYRKGEEFTLYALSEKNPTFVNGKPARKVTLTGGDRIRLAGTELQFDLVSPQEADTPPTVNDYAAASPSSEDTSEAGPAHAAASPSSEDTCEAGPADAATEISCPPASACETKKQTGSARLLVIDGKNAGREYSLAGKEKFRIGRSVENEISLSDRKVSRSHCIIEEVQGQYVLIDLESANGTVVNGEKVRKTVLQDGDFLRLGLTMLIFSCG